MFGFILLFPSHLCLLPQQLVFDSSFFFFSHSFLVLFEVFPFPGLKVEPCVGEGTNLGQQSLNEWMEFILCDRETDTHWDVQTQGAVIGSNGSYIQQFKGKPRKPHSRYIS